MKWLGARATSQKLLPKRRGARPTTTPPHHTPPPYTLLRCTVLHLLNQWQGREGEEEAKGGGGGGGGVRGLKWPFGPALLSAISSRSPSAASRGEIIGFFPTNNSLPLSLINQKATPRPTPMHARERGKRRGERERKSGGKRGETNLQSLSCSDAEIIPFLIIVCDECSDLAAWAALVSVSMLTCLLAFFCAITAKRNAVQAVSHMLVISQQLMAISCLSASFKH